MKKRVLSLLLAVLMLLPVLPMGTISASALTGDQRTDIINVAIGELGNTNGSKYTFGAGNVSWCAYFISWCARQANIDSSIIKTNGWADADDFGVKYYPRGSYTPKKGDIIIFDYYPYNPKTPASAYGDHVGLVEYVEGNTVHTIEGNSIPKPNAVRRHSYSLSDTDIKGYGVPNYKGSTPVKHTVNSNYGKNFVAYLNNPSRQTPVYDESHNLVSGRYISGNDPCTIHEVYTDGCCKVSYVTDSGVTRTYYTKFSYFKTPGRHWVMDVWATADQEKDSPAITSGYAGKTYKIWYKMYDKETGDLYPGTDYKVKVSACYPDGSEVFSHTYENSSYNWIRITPDVTGTYKIKVKLTAASSKELVKDFEVNCDGKVSWENTSLNLNIPNKTSAELKASLSGTHPSGAKVKTEYDSNIISVKAEGNSVFTVTALKPGTTNLVITTMDKNLNYISSSTCKVTVTAETYTVTYNANGGTGAPPSQTKKYGETITLSNVIPKKTGYTFTKWSSGSNGSGFQFSPGAKYTYDFNTNLYAQYSPNQYSIKYNANGGTGSMSNSVHAYDTAKALTANSFTRNGYTFLGWSTSSTATTATYTEKQSVKNLTSTNGATVTLYAVWQKNPATVSSISIKSLPKKTDYVVGEEFITLGLAIKVTMSDGSTELLAGGFNVSTPDMTTAGTKTVRVTYGGKETSFNITVKEPISAKTGKYKITGATATPGSTIQVYISIEDNPGIISLRNQIKYDTSVLELVKVEDLKLLAGYTTPSPTITSPYTLRWADSLATKNNTSNGNIVKLTFKVKDTAKAGDYNISVSHVEARTTDGEKVEFSQANAVVTVVNYLLGDVDMNGEVNDWDAIVLNRYLAGWSTTINKAAADIDKDSSVTDWDAIALERKLAGWK